MRYGRAALLMLISSAATTSAQDRFTVSPPTLAHGVIIAPIPTSEARVSLDEVVARLMLFDRDRNGKVATDELSERMQSLVARGDRGGDGALDATEIRSLAEAPPQVPLFRNLQFGGYSFGETVGQSSRTHIFNTIDDLRLAPQADEEARRIAAAFADALEAAALANLRHALAPMLTEAELAEVERNIKGDGMRSRAFRIVSSNGGATQSIVMNNDPGMVLRKFSSQWPVEQMKAATAAVETFKAEQQLDDARRSALVAQLSGILTEEEGDNFRAALARRPLVKGLGTMGQFQAVVREIGLTVSPASR